MKCLNLFFPALVAILLCAASVAVHATPLSYTGGSYFQDFDGLPMEDPATGLSTITLSGKGPHALNGVLGTTGMEGWTFGNPGGSSGNTEFKAHDGSFASSAGRGVVSFGANGTSDRALGQLPTGNQISAFGVTMRNDSGATLTQFSVSFTGEQWRRGDSAANTLFFSYSVGQDNINDETGFVGAPTLDFLTPNMQATTEVALNGNDPANQQFLSDTISGISWMPGELLTLRWRTDELSGQDNGLAIDNLSFTAAVPEPTSLTLLGLGIVCMLVRRKQL